MSLFNKQNVINALKSLAVMGIILMLWIFIGVAALDANGVFSWLLFGGFLMVYFIAAYVDGSIRGQGECRRAELLDNQVKRTGKPLDENEVQEGFSKKKGAAVALIMAVPGILLTLASAVTGDSIGWLRVVTRLYYTPYLKLLGVNTPLIVVMLIYFAGMIVYPLIYFIGYLAGPRQHAKVKAIIRKNDEDYKKGIRVKRRKVKRRRGFFS